MSDLGTMVTRIGREIRRTDLDDAIRDHIETAVEYFRGTRFWFLDDEFYMVTESGVRNYPDATSYTIEGGGTKYQGAFCPSQDFDTVITVEEVIRIDHIRIAGDVDITDEDADDEYVWTNNLNTQDYMMNEVQSREMDRLRGPASETGKPYQWCFKNKQLYIWPVPNDAYLLQIQGMVYPQLASDDADTTSNVWTLPDYAEAMIRLRAIGNLYATDLHKLESAQWYYQLAAQEYQKHVRESDAKLSQGEYAIRPWPETRKRYW